MVSSQFPIENVPFGIISTTDDPSHRAATIIEDTVIDLSILEREGVFYHIPGYPAQQKPLNSKNLNAFAALDKGTRAEVRAQIQAIWKSAKLRTKHEHAFIPVTSVKNHLPMETINYADYVSSLAHSENMGNLMGMPEPARNPFYHFPPGYYGNSRNIVVSGSPVYRFEGPIERQFQKDGPAITGPSQKFDFELELGVYLSKPSQYGRPVKLDEVDEHVFGFVLLNDWSARDIQGPESAGPTGPFLGKSGCVTVSPWIITLEALQAASLPRQQAPIVPFVDYLSEKAEDEKSVFDIRCSVLLKGNQNSIEAFEVCRTEYRQTYWTYRQLIAHQTRNGSWIGTGDLVGTGTMSIDTKNSDIGRCCLAERSYLGKKPFDIGNGQTRTWLENGDEVHLQGWVHDAKNGEKLFGFGDCSGVVLPLPSY